MSFPAQRMRRLRKTGSMRGMVAETHLSVDDFVYPLFVCHGTGIRREIGSMPGNFHLSVDQVVSECTDVAALGIPAVLLFGLPEAKDSMGSEAISDEGIVQQAVRAIKTAVPELTVITDVCFCEYTDHGHCGVIKDGRVDNDATLELLALQAVSHAKAGADMIAPSDMMDGRIAAIRSALDSAGFADIPIMSYAAKYSSAFYGPFREAADSAPQFGDRRAYQMDPRNGREAVREVALDIEEGADIVMVKPALSYLDIIHRIRTSFDVPVAAYNVSGEYSCVQAAAERGWVDGERVMMEILYSIKRAGADIIITYHAKDAARLLNG
jgi:porphobilinogen synthase